MKEQSTFLTILSFNSSLLLAILQLFINFLHKMHHQEETDIFTRSIIEDTFQRYLNEFKIEASNAIEDNIVTSPKEKLLLAFIRDFGTFKIDFDLLISLIGMIWIINPEKFDPLKQTKVEKLCFHSLELQWAIRNEPMKHIDQLEFLLKYYKMYKRKLEEV